jgi:hypothetical protein
VSLDELQALAADKEQMATAIPALLPIELSKFRRLGPFGMRLHPIYAAGDGYVSFTGRTGGYGINVIVDHGFGYQTQYAHLSKILVTNGQFVRRGEEIAEMGSTGTSTSAHLHYEVRYVGQKVNPTSYFQLDMDPAEFEKIIESANDNAIYDTWDQQ